MISPRSHEQPMHGLVDAVDLGAQLGEIGGALVRAHFLGRQRCLGAFNGAPSIWAGGLKSKENIDTGPARPI